MATFVMKPEGGLFGDRRQLIFSDTGKSGSGIPRYTKNPAYAASAVPRVIGARWYCGPCGTHDGEDDSPDVIGDIFSGGRAAYQVAVKAHNDEQKHKGA